MLCERTNLIRWNHEIYESALRVSRASEGPFFLCRIGWARKGVNLWKRKVQSKQADEVANVEYMSMKLFRKAD